MSKYDLIYVYDLKPRKHTEMGKIKRSFYYHLNKRMPFLRRATESVILTTKAHEKHLDEFFQRFIDDVEVYKCEIRKLTIIRKTTSPQPESQQK